MRRPRYDGSLQTHNTIPMMSFSAFLRVCNLFAIVWELNFGGGKVMVVSIGVVILGANMNFCIVHTLFQVTCFTTCTHRDRARNP
ncbi:hypothetical protein K440DRAFT_379411 [Wilcoxina mikolae CBS 423.85]|nr:hypothetical protein K440DRAFT_379411 [Wilcoxina mikolae CBS 423.85]